MNYIAEIPTFDNFITILQKYKKQGLSAFDIASESLKQINGEIEELTGILHAYEREDDYLSEKLAYKAPGSSEYQEYDEFCKTYSGYPKQIEEAMNDRKKAIAEIKLYFYYESMNVLTRSKKELELTGSISEINQEKINKLTSLSKQYVVAASELDELEGSAPSYMHSTRIQELKSQLSVLPFENSEIALDIATKAINLLEKAQIQPGE